MAIPNKTLRDAALILRPIDFELDAPEWCLAMQEPDMHMWTGNRVPSDIDEVRQLLLGYITNPDIIVYAALKSPKVDVVACPVFAG